MRVSLFGIGYVGSVSAACLARDGHTVIAVDVNPQKVEALNRGVAPMVEPGLDALVQAGVSSEGLSATTSAADAVAGTEVSIICVGTPSAPDGALDLSAVERVAAVVGEALAWKPQFHAILIRSTLAVNATMTRIAPVIEQASGLKVGVDFGLACYPEFLREGSAIEDYDAPAQAVAAVTDDETLARLLALHPPSAAPPTVVSFPEAEAVKAVSNAWHAVKVAFANEIGGVLGAQGVDGGRVMELVCQDAKLNISAAYMRPGFAFGGSCLPKDVRALTGLGKAGGRPALLLEGALDANQALIDRAVALVEAAGRKRVSIIGLAFKPGTDDLRESPYLILAARLAAKGYDLRLFDESVRVERLTGANLAYATEHLPGLAALLCATVEAAADNAETLVLAHRRPGAEALDRATPGQRIIDLVRVRPGLRSGGAYAGLSW